MKAVMGVASIQEARQVLKDKGNLRDGSIRLAFEAAGKKTKTYSNKLPTRTESRVNHVKWISTSNRPFAVVEDPGYHLNMRTGPAREGIYIPSSATVGKDVRLIFNGARKKISKLLKVTVNFNNR